MVTNNNLTEQVDQTTEQVDQTTEQVKIKNTLLESRKATKESYDQLDKAKYPEPTDEEIAEEKKNITEETQKKLDANELSADDYAKFLVFEQKYEKDLRKDGNSERL
jgi:DNA-directed RNA polymerase specialized sigma subunit